MDAMTKEQRAAMIRVTNEVETERYRQHMRWGEQSWPDGTGDPFFAQLARISKRACDNAAKSGELTYLDILMEEFYEAAAESERPKLRAELIQLAAVAVAWVEKLDREAAR